MTAGRLSTLVIAFFVAAILLLSAGADPAALNPLVYGLTIASYVFIVLIIRPTLKRPRIGALSERTFIGVVIAFLGTVASIIVYNTDHERILFDAKTAALLFREAILGVLLIPAIWILLFVAGRLGQEATNGSAALTRLEAQGDRIEASLAANTEISQGARDDAHDAVVAANEVNAKLAGQADALIQQGADRADREAGR